MEVQNAISTYARLDQLDAFSMKDFLSARHTLMSGLIAKPGAFRTGNVGITKGSELAHLAPNGAMVKGLMKD